MTYDELFSKHHPSQFIWKNPDLCSRYGLWLYNRYSPMANDMFNKICEKMGINRSTIFFNVVVPAPFSAYPDKRGVATRLGMFFTPSRIDIYLVGIAMVAHDNMKKLGRDDFDTMMKAEMAHTIIHELSHSQQMTYSCVGNVDAMEYANERRVMDELYPLLELMLKRNYKIDLIKDRITENLNTVYSMKYNNQHDSYNRVINYIVFNFYDYDGNDLTQSQFEYLDGYKTKLAEYPAITLTIRPNPFRMEGVYHIKRDGIIDYKECDRFLSNCMHAPVKFGFDANYDGTEEGMSIDLTLKYSSTYNPIFYMTDDNFPMDEPPLLPAFME